MTTAVKAVAGVLGAATIGAGGIVMSKFGGTRFNPESSWHSLAEDFGYITSSYSDKFAEKLTRYFVGPGPKKSNTSQSNEEWWEWSLKKLKEDNIQTGKFSAQPLEMGYANVTNYDKSLNNVCDNAYKANSTDVVDENSDGTKFNKSEVWKYCSPVGQEPKTIDKRNSADNNEKQSGTKGEEGKTTLISVADEGNKVFWEIREKEFKDPSFTVNASHQFFQKSDKHIKDLCKEAYEKKTSDTSPTKDETKKYCSLEQLNSSSTSDE